MARETQKDKIARLEAENAELKAKKDEAIAAYNELAFRKKPEVTEAVTGSEEYQSLKKQLAEERIKATEAERLYKAEAEKREKLRQAYIQLKECYDTSENDSSESVDNSELPEHLEEWQQGIVACVMEAYNRAGKDRGTARVGAIVKTWCKARECKETLEILYTHFIKPQQVALDAVVTTQNALQNDLDAAQAELQRVTRHNARNAGRKPKFTDEQMEQIRKMSADGLSVRKIATEMSCSIGLICKILHSNKN